MSKELHGPLTPSPEYPEYVLFCEQENITPVLRAEFTGELWMQLCKEYGVANAITDEHGIPWTFFIEKYGDAFARGPVQ